MKHFENKYTIRYLLFAIILFGAFLRFYNLNWGAPYYFHPDERNIASSISQLNFPWQMNPHFFAYGSFPIYVSYFVGIIFNLLFQVIHAQAFDRNIFFVSFENAIISLRLISVLLSISIIPLIYFTGKKLGGRKVGLLAAILSSISVGFIQFAHFGTFEIWLTFLSLLFFYLCLRNIEKITLKNIIVLCVVLALLFGTKISSLVILPLPFLLIIKNIKGYKKITYSFLSLFAPVIILLLISPFFILDFNSFRGSMQYESSVALGTLPVFYIGEFFNSLPILFQFTRIYPFLLNPIITLLLIPSIVYILYQSFKKKLVDHYLLFAIFSLLFFSQAFFFAKWTRYMVPTLPFIYLMISLTLISFLKLPIKNVFKNIFFTLIIFGSFLYTTSYFITAFVKADTRISAASFAQKNISRDSNILSEVYDLGITPFNPLLSKITLFNFYDLDQTPSKEDELSSYLSNYDYLILPSQRILKSRLIQPKQFPVGYNVYKKIVDELGFKKIYQSPCDIFCKITYLNNPVFSFEETANIFDRPTVFIYKIMH
ncbi:MAG: glycosyltransferase family 39 protein [Candidatus Levyibacteriota bacterium]